MLPTVGAISSATYRTIDRWSTATANQRASTRKKMASRRDAATCRHKKDEVADLSPRRVIWKQSSSPFQVVKIDIRSSRSPVKNRWRESKCGARKRHIYRKIGTIKRKDNNTEKRKLQERNVRICRNCTFGKWQCTSKWQKYVYYISNNHEIYLS